MVCANGGNTVTNWYWYSYYECATGIHSMNVLGIPAGTVIFVMCLGLYLFNSVSVKVVDKFVLFDLRFNKTPCQIAY